MRVLDDGTNVYKRSIELMMQPSFLSLIGERDLNFRVRLVPTKTNQSINQEHNLPAGQLGVHYAAAGR